MANLSVIGFMGSGKSEAGRITAGLLCIPFIDTDDMIEEAEGLTIPGIFRKHGEPYFRARESEILSWALSGEDRIISVGGGAPVEYRNRYILRQRSKTVWLRCAVETLLERLTDSERAGRPLLMAAGRERVEKLVGERSGFYSFADEVVDTEGLTAYDVARRIVSLFR